MPRKCRPTSLAEALAEREVESHKKALKRPKGSISEVYLFFRSPKTIRIPFGPLRLMFPERKRSNSCHKGRCVKDGYRRFHASTPGHSLSSPLGSRSASRNIEPGERLTYLDTMQRCCTAFHVPATILGLRCPMRW